MATRSVIAIKREKEDKYIAVYCHFDGYLSGVGKTLLENYNTAIKVVKLIHNGEIRSLGKTIEESEFYKDVGEDIYIKTDLTLESLKEYCENTTAEYLYIFDKDVHHWTYSVVYKNTPIAKLTPEDLISK